MSLLTLAVFVGAGPHQDKAESIAEPVKVLRGFRGFATSLSFSPDGRSMVSAGQEGAVRLWDTSSWTGRVLLNMPQTTIASAAFSPDGDSIAAGIVGDLYLWDAPDWRQSQVANGSVAAFTAQAFSRDGGHLALGRSDGGLIIYETAGWQPVRSMKIANSLVTDLAFLPNGSRIIVSAMAADQSAQEGVRVIDWEIPRVVRTWPQRGGAPSLAVSRTGATTVTGGFDGLGRVWDTGSGKVRRMLRGHVESIVTTAFSPDNRILALGSEDGTVSLWNASSWSRLGTITGLDAVTALAWSPDSGMLVTAGWDKTIRIWRIKARTQ